jgi:hypothetical protein
MSLVSYADIDMARILFLILACASTFGAAGDISSPTIKSGTDGTYIEFTVAGVAIGGTYSGNQAQQSATFGLGSNNNPIGNSPYIVVTVQSPGYSSADLTTNVVTRTLWGTKVRRKAYASQADADETTSGSDAIVRVYLSDAVYSEDVCTVTMRADTYRNVTQSAAVTAMACVNSSTAAYQKAGGVNWCAMQVPFENMTNATTWPIYVHGAHRDADCTFTHTQGPVAGIAFTASDTSGNTVTGLVTQTSIVISNGIGHEVFKWDMPLSSLTQGNTITVNASVYPVIGKATEIAASSSGPAFPTPLFGPRAFLNNKTGAYGMSYAVVDTSAGSDPAGVTLGDDASKWVGALGAADDPDAGGTGGGVTAYATVARAIRAIRNRNNSISSRDDVAGVVYVKAGNYNWAGATISGGYGSTPATYVTVRPYPGVARASVVFNGTSGNTAISGRVRIYNCTITSTANNTWSMGNALVFDECDYNAGGANIQVFSRSGSDLMIYSRGGKLQANGAQGWVPSGNNNNLPAGMFNVDVSGFVRRIMIYTDCGIFSTGNTPVGPLFIDHIAGQSFTASVPIFLDSSIKNVSMSGVSSPIFQLGALQQISGATFAGNVVEMVNDGGAGMFDFAAGEGVTTNTPVDNVIFWNNTLLGGRTQFAYNSSGTTVKYRRYWSWHNNILHDFNIKMDMFAPHASLLGAFGFANGEGVSGSVNLETTGANGVEDFGASGSFAFEYEGISSYQPARSAITGASQAQNTSKAALGYPQFITYAGYQGATTGAGTGNGDYKITNLSPIQYLPMRLVKRYDITGNNRGASCPPGAYASASPRKSGFFF